MSWFTRNKKTVVEQSVPAVPEKPYVTINRGSRLTYKVELYGFDIDYWTGRPKTSISYIDYWYVIGRGRAEAKAKRKLARHLRLHGYVTEAETRITTKDV